MNIEYQNAVAGCIPPASGYLPGVLAAIPTGGFTIQKPNGKFQGLDNHGNLIDFDGIDPMCAWVPDDQINVLRCGYGNSQGPRFAVWFRYA